MVFGSVSAIDKVAGVFVTRGPHLGAAAIAKQAREGLLQAGQELDAVAMPLGEPGSAALLVRQIGGRVYQLEGRGLEDGHFALLPDRSALIDGSCIIHHSTRGVGEALRSAAQRGATQALVLIPSDIRHDGGRGLVEVFGGADEAGTVPCPLVELSTIPLGQDESREGHRHPFPSWHGLSGRIEPAVPYLAALLGLEERIRRCEWVLANTSRIGYPEDQVLLDWLVPVTREAGRPLWVLVADVGREYQDLLKKWPVGLYPIAPGPLSTRQLERRERHLVRDAAHRLGIFMGGDPG
jgi:hypothetical protein